MTETIRAADLPEGSVVANDVTVLIAWLDQYQTQPRWRGNVRGAWGDADVDLLLHGGAQVLRVGTGKEG